MIIQETESMTAEERLAIRNSNFQYLNELEPGEIKPEFIELARQVREDAASAQESAQSAAESAASLTIDQAYNSKSENAQSGTAVAEAIDPLCKTSSNIYDSTDPSFEDGIITVNDSGKCLFFISQTQQYRGFIFPIGGITKNIGFKFIYSGSGISTVRLACFDQKPTSNEDSFVALNQIKATISGDAVAGLLPVSAGTTYLVFAVAFTSGVNYDDIYAEIKNNLYMFETAAPYYRDVDWENINYIPHRILNVTMASIPDELKNEVENKVNKAEGKGLSENDFTDEEKAKLESAYNEIFPASDIIIKYGDAGITNGSWASPTNGNIYSTSRTRIYDVTDFIPCKNGDSLYLCEVQSIAFYKPDQTYSSGITISDIQDYTGNGLQNNYTINDENAKYMRINFYNSNYTSQMVGGLYAACQRNSLDYKILNLGDSIFGLNPKPYDVSSKIELQTGLKTANCGFGGTRASVHTLSDYVNFSLFNLADSIASNDFTLQDNSDFSTLGSGYYYRYNLATLKSIDFSALDIITIAYGTNDWNANIPLDDTSSSENTNTFKGALRYSINKIQSAYPGIMIILLSPIYRTFSSESTDSNAKVNTLGLKLLDYVQAVEEVANEYELPFFNNYKESGINKFNSSKYLRDGTHLSFIDGAKRIGIITGNKIEVFA